MKYQLALALTLATTTAFAADRNFDRTLPVGNSPNVAISTSSGFIHLHPGNDNQIQIKAHVKANQNNGWFSGNSGDNDRRVEEIANHPPIQQNGNDIVIGERQTRDLYRNITIDYDITVPRNASLAPYTGSGDIEVQDVGQSLRAETGSGSLRVHGVHGPAALHTGSGDIQLEESAQGDVKLDTGSGSIRAKGIVGGLRAQTGSGDMEIEGRIQTDWRLETGSGSVHLNLGQDARFNLNATTGSGDIRVRQSIANQENNHHRLSGAVNGGGPNLRINTGSGDIEIK